MSDETLSDQEVLHALRNAAIDDNDVTQIRSKRLLWLLDRIKRLEEEVDEIQAPELGTRLPVGVVITFDDHLASLDVMLDAAQEHSHCDDEQLADLLFRRGIGISRGNFYGTEHPDEIIPTARLGAMYLRRSRHSGSPREPQILYYNNPPPDGWTVIGTVAPGAVASSDAVDDRCSAYMHSDGPLQRCIIHHGVTHDHHIWGAP